MGAIKSSQQMGQDGKPNGLIDLEITYGGNEAPFGGLDASAPPQYIDPHCFTDCTGFIVAAKQLIAYGYFPYGVSLTGWTALYNFLGAGTFYANGKYNNWALGYATQHVAGVPPAPGYTQTVYHIWVWDAGFIGAVAETANITVQQYDQENGATAATAIVDFSGGQAFNTGSTDIVAGGHTDTVAIALHDTDVIVAANMVAQINGDAGALVTAALGAAPWQIVLTTKATGAATNATTLSVDVTDTGMPYPTIIQTFQGGMDGNTVVFPNSLDPLSWVAIGETLYFGGPGAVILKFNIDPILGAQFSIATQYVGAITLNKFAGFLIAGGVVPGPNTIIQAPEMVIAWSANGQYTIWNPLDANGNVTGAGFNQEADISDYITAIFIMSSMAIVLRTQGVDYLTPLGSALQPFDFEHITNSRLGEGCQDGRLATQYDQMGLFVGNSDVFEYVGGLRSAGAKIKQLIINAVNAAIINRSSSAGPFLIDEFGIDIFGRIVIDLQEYWYNFDTRVWTKLNFVPGVGANNTARVHFWANAAKPAVGTQFNTEQNPILTTLVLTGPIGFQFLAPTFFNLGPGIQNSSLPLVTGTGIGASVTFKAEEIAFGKDITVDSVYMAIAGVPGQVVNFSVSGQLKGVTITKSGSVILGTEADGKTFRHYKGYFSSGTFVGKNPQLSITVSQPAAGVVNNFILAKATMFASFDPTQRPV